MKKKYRSLFICALLLAALVCWIAWGNKALTVTHYSVSSEALPKSFDGFRIAHISDLHNDTFGKENETLLGLIQDAAPDIIVVTGDLLDSYNTDVEAAAAFMESAVTIAPCYYVLGNHENRIPNEYAQLRKRMTLCGVTILNDQSVTAQRSGEQLILAGLMDYKSVSSHYISATFPGSSYTVLLTHRPEHFEQYRAAGMDLILAGHAHGGQIRLPFVGAIFAPGQGILPKYADGMHTVNGSTLIVSRGLGNSSLPFRVNNRPELVIVELHTQ